MSAYSDDRRNVVVVPTHPVLAVGRVLLILAMATIFLWIGAMKFTDYEAQGVAPFIANNPILSWMHGTLGIRGASQALGVVEVLVGVLLLGALVSPRLGVVGGLLSTITYVITLSCLVFMPGVGAPEAGGFPALSAEVGQFLAKDTVLFAASVFILGDSLMRLRRRF